MTPDIKPLIAGNWKMNGLQSTLEDLATIARGCAASAKTTDSLICPPTTLLQQAVTLCAQSPLQIGAQDCHTQSSGAFTGEVSASMVADCGAQFVIVGHSERRTLFQESDALICHKAEAGNAAGLIAIVCIGETEEQRKSGITLDVLEVQLAQAVPDSATAANTVIAYEPVWAIGTGLTPTAADVEKAHCFMRAELSKRFDDGDKMRILYGGSVKASNAHELMTIDNVDGALIGGASLKADDFLAIARVYDN